ncbi:MAG TPA: GerMN domain-containing protein [Thermoanaerobaculia bacterium]|nr:GerMN domain-containing protein [Thermoanaerobaculia bacterium]
MTPKRPLPWLLPLVVLAGLTCCARRDSAQGLEAGTRTSKVQVYVIALHDRGAQGRAAGCGDSVVPVDVDLPAPQPALEGALSALLTLQDGAGNQDLYNALAHSPLKIDRIDRTGPEVRVYLSGYVELGGDCDGPRIVSQLTETALQFHDLQHAQFFLDGKPLQGLLPGKG